MARGVDLGLAPPLPQQVRNLQDDEEQAGEHHPGVSGKTEKTAFGHWRHAGPNPCRSSWCRLQACFHKVVLLLGTQPIGHAQQVFDVLDVVRHFSGVKKPPEGGGLLLCLPKQRIHKINAVI